MLNKKVGDFKAEAILMSVSKFDQYDKDRHYRELLILMRNHFHRVATDDTAEFIRVYKMIESLIGVA